MMLSLSAHKSHQLTVIFWNSLQFIEKPTRQAVAIQEWRRRIMFDNVIKHLKIDLEDHEVLRLEPTSSAVDELLAKAETNSLITEDDMGRNLSESKPITQVGEYCAKIYLYGGFCVPLFVRVVRKP